MKKYMKKIIKSRIFLCILTGLVVGSLSAGAATYFASGDVSYDNSESGLKSTDVQSAIDELYNECFPPIPSTEIGGQKIELVTTGDGLYEDEYEEGKYVYKGTNPNNYIIFSEKTWRIMSVESDGTLKIINYKPIVTRAWDTSSNLGINNWARPATLNTYLNETYLLSLSQKDKVVLHDWAIGAVTDDNNDLASQIEVEKETLWNGKVGLMTVSEYLKANININQCRTISLNNSNSSICKTTNYLYNIIPSSEYLWTLSAVSNSLYNVFNISAFSGGGYITDDYAYRSYINVAPVVYLSSDITLIGEGTLSDPYVITN